MVNLAKAFRVAEHAATLHQRPVIRASLIIAIFFMIVTVAFPTWRILPLIKGSPLVPLHANVHFGVDWTGPWWMVYTMPVLAVVILAVNAILAWFYGRRNAFLADILFIATACMAVLLFIGMIFLVLINLAYA